MTKTPASVAALLKDRQSRTHTMTSTVLIVEDDEILHSLTVDAISLLDLEMVDCASADDALFVLEDHVLEDHPSIALVITDICMPGSMDGLELEKVIWTRWPRLPVILTSGDRTVPVGLLPAHAMFMRKPWSLDALHQAVRAYLPV
jgi:DNA-binding NtrC family response regulator